MKKIITSFIVTLIGGLSFAIQFSGDVRKDYYSVNTPGSEIYFGYQGNGGSWLPETSDISSMYLWTGDYTHMTKGANVYVGYSDTGVAQKLTGKMNAEISIIAGDAAFAKFNSAANISGDVYVAGDNNIYAYNEGIIGGNFYSRIERTDWKTGSNTIVNKGTVGRDFRFYGYYNPYYNYDVNNVFTMDNYGTANSISAWTSENMVLTLRKGSVVESSLAFIQNKDGVLHVEADTFILDKDISQGNFGSYISAKTVAILPREGDVSTVLFDIESSSVYGSIIADSLVLYTNPGEDYFGGDVNLDFNFFGTAADYILGSELILFQTTNTIVGSFANVEDGDIFTYDGVEFMLNITDTKVSLTVVPEASEVALLAGLLALGFAAYRRRK